MHLKQKGPSKKYNFSLLSWQSNLLEIIKAHNMWDGTTSQDGIRCFTSRHKLVTELVFPAHLHEVALLRLVFGRIGTCPARPVREFASFLCRFFSPFFHKTSFPAYAFMFWLSICNTSLTCVHLHSCMSEYVIWCMFVEILACTFIWNVSVFH